MGLSVAEPGGVPGEAVVAGPAGDFGHFVQLAGDFRLPVFAAVAVGVVDFGLAGRAIDALRMMPSIVGAQFAGFQPGRQAGGDGGHYRMGAGGEGAGVAGRQQFQVAPEPGGGGGDGGGMVRPAVFVLRAGEVAPAEVIAGGGQDLGEQAVDLYGMGGFVAGQFRQQVVGGLGGGQEQEPLPADGIAAGGEPAGMAHDAFGDDRIAAQFRHLVGFIRRG